MSVGFTVVRRLEWLGAIASLALACSGGDPAPDLAEAPAHASSETAKASRETAKASNEATAGAAARRRAVSGRSGELLWHLDIGLIGVPPIAEAVEQFASPNLSLDITFLEIDQTKPYPFFHLAPPMLPNLGVHFIQNLVSHGPCVFEGLFVVRGHAV